MEVSNNLSVREQSLTSILHTPTRTETENYDYHDNEGRALKKQKLHAQMIPFDSFSSTIEMAVASAWSDDDSNNDNSNTAESKKFSNRRDVSIHVPTSNLKNDQANNSKPQSLHLNINDQGMEQATLVNTKEQNTDVTACSKIETKVLHNNFKTVIGEEDVLILPMHTLTKSKGPTSTTLALQEKSVRETKQKLLLPEKSISELTNNQALSLDRNKKMDRTKIPSSIPDTILPVMDVAKPVETMQSTVTHLSPIDMKKEEFRTEIVTKFITLEDIPHHLATPLPPLTAAEKAELEIALQLNSEDPEDWWREDWSGNLAFSQKDVSNPVTKRRKAQKTEMVQTILEWAQSQPLALRLGRNLLALVYQTAPPSAKNILAHISTSWGKDPTNFDIFEALKRCSYDPSVLREDGWITSPDSQFDGSASGGPKHIGREILWEGYEAVVIAYVLDSEIGDLWKAMWIESYETFDLEAEELEKAAKKWERKHKKSLEKKQANETGTTARPGVAKDFTVEGIEHGIILATASNPKSRRGLFWPARVMHVSELSKAYVQSKRGSSKLKISVIFLCPYWNSGISDNSSADYPLFEFESIDVSEDCIQKYPHDGRNGINIHQLRVSFRFTGLPKSAFGRFLDGHRLAMALKLYSQNQLSKTMPYKPFSATAALFDTHPLALNAAHFPSAVLHLPFGFMLSKIEHPPKTANENDVDQELMEPVLNLHAILKAMEPPQSFGLTTTGAATQQEKNRGHQEGRKNQYSIVESPMKSIFASKTDKHDHVSSRLIDLHSILSEYLREELTTLASTDLPSASLLDMVKNLARRANHIGDMKSSQKSKGNDGAIVLKSFLHECLRIKSYGEDCLAADYSLLNKCFKLVLTEWRKSCERVIKHTTLRCSSKGIGSEVTVILTDFRCNEHITKEGCVERPIRLPAALKGARLAGAGTISSLPMYSTIEDYYMNLAKDKILEKAHTSSYLKKMQVKCASIAPDENGTNLTEGSDGEGGCDTTGSRGTFDAAVAGVAAAIKAVDWVVGGKCVNAFCATRPPGHHAGRSLHPMGAESNGFCILNPVACAAIFATTPPSEGGLGLKRAAVIDFDVHHGNGTQDILCSTYDPRFLYVSIHAGGAQINGNDTDESDDEDDGDLPKVGKGKKLNGIFPGRSGDTSPHKGVLNIPLGQRVTPHEVGNALFTLIEPAIEAFSPDIMFLSAGFDGHKNDPLGMGGLSAHDFGHLTDVACAMALRFCSGRIVSVLEGGYGVPCCRPQKNSFLPHLLESSKSMEETTSDANINGDTATRPSIAKRMRSLKIYELGDSLPENMDDQVTPALQRRLEKCHSEGFVDCIREHVASLHRNKVNA